QPQRLGQRRAAISAGAHADFVTRARCVDRRLDRGVLAGYAQNRRRRRTRVQHEAREGEQTHGEQPGHERTRHDEPSMNSSYWGELLEYSRSAPPGKPVRNSRTVTARVNGRFGCERRAVRSLHGNSYPEGGAVTRRGFDFDRAAVGARDLIDDVQTKAD